MQSLIPSLLLLPSLISATAVHAPNPPTNITYLNPILPGWHSDPNCVFVPALHNTTFCIASSFLAFPSLPLYSSRDLTTWTLASNVFNRPSQVPEFATLDTNADEGFWAATVRYHDGLLYAVVTYIDYDPKLIATYYLFSTTDPFDYTAWSGGLKISNRQKTIDPDLFWDDDGTVYMASGWGAIYLSTVDLTTGTASSPAARIWNGTGGSNPEGPHIYKKDGYYYLLIAEGGSGPNHSATITRSPSIWGPYESYAGNPILTNRGTDEYFQTVGHADFFEDKEGNWWGAALATRSVPEFEISPMGRETVMFPVSWPEGGWPVAAPVRGEMSGWHLPRSASPPRRDEILVDGADVVDFHPGEAIPRNWVYHRIAIPSSFIVSPRGHEKTLQLVPSAANLTGNAAVRVEDGLTFVGRRQTATLFKFSVDVDFEPRAVGKEAGITVFISQEQHINLSIVATGQSTGLVTAERQLRFRATTFGKPDVMAPEEVVVEIPESWGGSPVRLVAEARDDEGYTFSAESTRGKKEVRVIGRAGADIVTSGTGRFVGKLCV